jgi:RHS repeat-associated protein
LTRARPRALFAALTCIALLAALTPITARAQTEPDPSGLLRREIVSERTQHTKVFQEIDGTKTAVTYTQPIHFRAGDGSWKEIDNEIVPQPDGTGFENKAGGVSFDFAAGAGAPDLVEIAGSKGGFGFGLENARASEPVVAENTITYPDVFPGADLLFQVSGEALKELLVLKTPPGVRGPRLDYRFPLSNRGLTAETTDGGTIVMRDDSGEAVFSLPKPFMYDSAPGEAAFSEDIHFVLEQHGQKQFLRVTADAAWLTDPARVYPVFIDPTVGPKTPTLDTFVQSNIVNTPQDMSSELKSGYYTGGEGTFTARSLLKFDLSAIGNGSTINSATLSLFENHSYSCSNRVVEVYRITDNWGSNVTWGSKPGFAASPADTINAAKGYSSSCPSGRLNFNVQSIVSYWKNSSATNEGFGIRAQSESDVFGWKKFASDQTTNKPELTVNYTEPNNPPNEPLHISPNSGATTGKLPTLNATYRDPDAGDWGHVDFEIYQSGTCCGFPYRSGNGTGGNPGNTSSWTPSSTLPTGSYTWRARGNDGNLTSGWTSTTSFTVDATPPGVPDITSGPANPSRTTNPQYYFSGAEPGGSFTCRLLKNGAAYAGPSGCSSPASYGTSGDGTYTFYVSQTDAYGNTSAEDSWAYTLDNTSPPPPSIYSSPSSPSQGRNPTWYFSGETNARFECRLRDTGSESFESCSSPKSYDLTGRADKTYYFEVRQIDQAGNVSGIASSAYTLDTTAPAQPTITDGPSDPSNNALPSWSFTGEGGGSYQCQLTGPGVTIGPESCSSPKSYNLTSSSDGVYTFWVRQTDAAGNTSLWRTRGYTLDRQPPGAPTITSSPQSPSKGRTPQWAFVGDPGAPLQCRLLQNGLTVFDWAACTSPKTYDLAGKSDGAYVFQVRQLDAAGNASLPASSPNYVLDTTAAAAPSITGAPVSPSSSRSPAWSFSGENGVTFTCALRGPSGYVYDPATCSSPRQYDLTGRPDGTYTFEVSQTDAAGNTSATASSSYVLDTVAPGAPTLTGRPDDATNDATPTWNFSGETGAAFVCELRTSTGVVVFTAAACTSPHTYQLTAKDDGDYVFGVRQRDGAGNLSAEATDPFTFDRQVPGKPLGVTSTTHIPKVGFKAREIQMTWSPPAEPDLSGIRGYCFVFSTEINGGPSQTSSTTFENDTAKCTTRTVTTSATLNAGTYWFSVRAIDHAGNGGAEQTYGPMIVDPQGSPIPLAPTLTDVLAAQSDSNGMEQFYPYKSSDLGTYGAFANLHSGNAVVKGADFTIPGKGLNVVVGHTYNSGRSDASYHDTGVGRGWSLSLSDVQAGLDGVGAITDVDLNTPVVPTSGRVLTASGEVLGGILELTDGDGTVHRFIRPGEPGTRWDSPPGVSLRVVENLDPTVPTTAASYELVRPDGVTYHVTKIAPLEGGLSDTWHVSAIRDRNGNELSIRYRDLSKLSLPSISKIRAAEIHHNRAASNPVVTFDYDSASGSLKSINALPGTTDARTIAFSIGPDGYLNHVLEHPDTASARTTLFGYTPYERNALDPLDDVRLLTSVTDGRGHRTELRHDDGSATGENRLTKVCDRNDTATGAECETPWRIEYGDPDPSTRRQETRFFTPLGAETIYTISARDRVSESDPRLQGGNVLRIDDAGSPDPVVSSYEWVENRLVRKTDGMGDATSMEYNDLGLVTKLTTPAPNREREGLPDGAALAPVVTTFLYNAVDGYDYDRGCTPASEPGPVSSEMHCEAAAELARTIAADNYDLQQRITDFRYDTAGNLADVIGRKAHEGGMTVVDGRYVVSDPVAGDRATHMTYFDFGGIKKIEGPADGADDTTFSDYHTIGLPRTITDAKGKSKTFVYDGYGMVLSSTDRGGRESSSTYDLRNNLLTATAPGNRVTTFTYDPNDNKKSITSPNGAETDRDDDFKTKLTYQPNEWLEKTESPGAVAGEWIVTSSTFNLDGTKATDVSPVDGVTSYFYYPNQQLKQVSTPAGSGDHASAVTDYTYDAAGRKSVVTLPKVNDSNRPYEKLTYTPSGAVAMTRVSGAGAEAVTEAAYNAFGEQLQVLGPLVVGGVKEEQQSVYDTFGQVVETRRLVRAGKWLVRSSQYDPAGNLEVAKQPSGDDGPPLVTQYEYDVLNRLIEQDDPQNPGHRTEFTYLPEGQQEQRLDYKGADLKRSVLTVYNHDYTVRRIVSTDEAKTGKPTLAACNYTGDDFGTGYDADGHLLVTRTVKGFSGCAGGDVIAVERSEYDHAGRRSKVTQEVQAPGLAKVVRDQTFAYRADGALRESVWNNAHTTGYTHSKGGFMETATDWRPTPATARFDHYAAGNPATANLGDSATGTFRYHGDGSVSDLIWNVSGQTNPVRSHRTILYDLGGNRTREQLSITSAMPNALGDTQGIARFTYDLAARLTSWTSPFRLSETKSGTDQPETTFTLDDAGNIKVEKVTAGTTVYKNTTSTFEDARLESQVANVTGLSDSGADTETTYGFDYSGLGEETNRTAHTVVTGPISDTVDQSTATAYDPSGHTDDVDHTGEGAPNDVDYLYSASGDLIARTAGGKTTYFFYFDGGSRLAEEARPSGKTKVRYFNSSSGKILAEQRFEDGADGDPDENVTAWVWLLRDPDGNVATEVKDLALGPVVIAQRAYDPYGKEDKGGTSKLPNEQKSTLGFQSSITDKDTGNLLLGPRVYDPKTDRFTTADFYVGATSDMALGTDPLTGNRYLFAASNPVSFYEDGHRPCYGTYGCDAPPPGTTRRGSSAADFRRADSQSMENYVPLKVPYRGAGDGWHVAFAGVGVVDAGERETYRVAAYLDGISMTYVHQEAEVIHWAPGSEHYYLEASYTFDQLSIYDVVQRAGGGYTRDIYLDVVACGTKGCAELASPKPLDCVGMECGRYPTMTFKGYADISAFGRPTHVVATARVAPQLLLQAPDFHQNTIDLRPDFSSPLYHDYE